MAKSASLFIGLVLCIPFVFGIGLSPGRVDMNYMPGFEKTFTYYVSNTLNVPITAKVSTFYEDNRFAGALTVSKTDFTLGPLERQPFYVTLKLPADANNPGQSRIGVSAFEGDRLIKQGSVTVQGAVASVFHINGLYQGKYLELALSAAAHGEFEPVDFTLTTRNLGTDQITQYSARVEIYSIPDNLLVGMVDLKSPDTDPLISWFGTVFTGQFDGKQLKKGLYHAVATAYYDGEKRQTDVLFRIGTQGVKITDFPKQGFAGQIMKFPIAVESEYNLPYESVVATITLKDPETLQILRTTKTELTTIQPFEKRDLIGYLDLTGMNYGEYPLSIVLQADGELVGADVLFKVTDAEGNIRHQAGAATGFVGQKPRKPIFTTTNILIGIIMVLIVLNILWFLKGHRKEPPTEGQLSEPKEPVQ